MSNAEFYYLDKDAPKPNKPTQIGAVAFITKGNAILMECRSDCKKWSLIGGGLKIDESLEECLCREVKEETNLDVKAFSLIQIYSDPSRIARYTDGNILRIITVAYSADVEDCDSFKKSEESLKLQYFTYDELSSLDIVATHKHIVDDYVNRAKDDTAYA